MDRWSLSSSSKMKDEELEGLIRYYFVKGFEYVEIIQHRGKVISPRNLHRTLRRNEFNRGTLF